ncbi:hypothetical protein H8788_16750 [Parabacteroides faecis]|jgi:hypothetical protein|uniref:hypothetical protein n=1 Tax=Parabacteroides faecis TaxID=1217282 RepID=UPI00165664E8|nr:hypothetical protein [Parabacteroides faecis]MBC8619392.1 hypothetical protein [Parabacteroides faecis]
MDFPISGIEKTIQRGTILLSSMFEEIDHCKYFVVIGVSEDSVAGFFFINSNVHPSLYNKPDQLAMQYPLKHKDYSFLKYDSFLCATNILTKSRKDLANSIKSQETTIIGDLLEEHVNEVLEMVRGSKLFSKIDKKKYFYP